MSTPTDASRIAAPGRMIAFADGSTAQLRYSLRSFAHLEIRYGSMAAMIEAFNGISEAAQTMDRPMLGAILDIVGSGLLDSGFVPHARERVTTVRITRPDGATEARDVREVVDVTYVRQTDRRELGTLIEMAGIQALTATMQAAFEEAMPAAPVGEPEPPVGASTLNLPTIGPSLGMSSSISGPSPLGDLIARSGC